MLKRYFTCAYGHCKYWVNVMELKASLEQGSITFSGIKIGPVFNFQWIFDDSLTQNGPYSIFNPIQGEIIVTLQ